MLRALGHPLSLLVLLTSFVVATTLHGWVQAQVAARLGDSLPRAQGRTSLDPRRHLDPFGAVGAALAGLGWAKPLDSGTRLSRRSALLVALSGPLVNVLLGCALLVGWRFAYGPVEGTSSYAFATALQNGVPLSVAGLGEVGLLLAGASQLYLGVLNLVPLPPLDGGRVLFAYAGRSPGWQRAQQLLVEQNVGLVAVLALLLIPLGGPLPLLPSLLDTVLSPVIDLLIGS